MSYCTGLSIVKDYAGHKTIATLRCKRWSCPDCGPRRALDLRWRARNARPTKFLTLTIRKGMFPTPDEQAAQMVEGWKLLRQYLCRLYGWKAIPFIAIFEKHKSGWPHLHILMRCDYVPQRVIRDWWQARFQSHMVWIEKIDSPAKAAKYISKYVSKAPEAFAHCKRYWASHDYDLTKPEKFVPADAGTYMLEILQGTPEHLVQMALLDGAQATWDGKKWIVERWRNIQQERWFK